MYLTEKSRVLQEKARTPLREMEENLISVLIDNEYPILMSSLLKVQRHPSGALKASHRQALRQRISVDNGKELP